MQVVNISNTIFKASSATIAANTSLTHNKINTEEVLYNDINAFINEKIDKNEYIKRFRGKISNLDTYKGFSKAERDYIQQLTMTIDSVKNNDEIYSGYLKWLMKNILKYKDSEK